MPRSSPLQPIETFSEISRFVALTTLEVTCDIQNFVSLAQLFNNMRSAHLEDLSVVVLVHTIDNPGVATLWRLRVSGLDDTLSTEWFTSLRHISFKTYTDKFSYSKLWELRWTTQIEECLPRCRDRGILAVSDVIVGAQHYIPPLNRI